MNKNLTYFFVFILLILSFVFYWYSYRPEKIRRDCINSFASFPEDSAEKYSKNCILQNGLKY